MQNKVLNILSIIAAISLLGILFTQGIWLKKSTTAINQQFDYRANQMLENVLNELQISLDSNKSIRQPISPGSHKLFYIIDTSLLDKLLIKHSEYLNLPNSFEYALINSESLAILYATAGYEFSQEKEAYKVCLTSLCKNKNVHLSVFYPEKRKMLVSRLIGWVILSFIFSVSALGTFVFIVLKYNKQKKIDVIKNDFVNNMTHELKTPLATISVAAEVLQQTGSQTDNKYLKKYSGIILDENRRMRKVVEKVLDIATMETGQLILNKEEIDIHSIICKTANNFYIESFPKNGDLFFDLNAKNSIIKGDALHIRNIISNLIDNAIKYSEDNLRLKISSLNIDNFLKLSVSDNGKGISKQAIDKVFEKFYRVPSGNLHNVKGFGLGLYYVKTMTEAHNGYVEITSQPEKGTNISLYLPQ